MAVAYDEVLDYLQSGEVTVEQLVAIRDAINVAVPEDKPAYWHTDQATVFKVGDREIDLITRGRPQIAQIQAVMDWLRTYAKPAITKLYPQGKDAAEIGAAEGFDLLLEVLDTDALVDLGAVVSREERAFVEEHFDLAWILDGVGVILRNQPAIGRVIQGFFGRRG